MSRTPRWESAYCEFFEARRRPMMRTAYAILGSWPAAEDATQTAMTQMYVHWPRIQSAAVDAYARRTLVNTCFRLARTRGREHLTDQPPDRPSAGHDRDVQIDLMSALDSLSPRDRAVLVLRFDGRPWRFSTWFVSDDGFVVGATEMVAGASEESAEANRRLDPAAIAGLVTDGRLTFPAPARVR